MVVLAVLVVFTLVVVVFIVLELLLILVLLLELEVEVLLIDIEELLETGGFAGFKLEVPFLTRVVGRSGWISFNQTRS